MATQASGYAAALLKAALAKGCVQRVKTELSEIEAVLIQLGAFFFNPEVPVGRHAALLQKTLEQQVDDVTMQFLLLLAKKRSLRKLPDICRRFEAISAAFLDQIPVKLRMPYLPDPALLDQINEYLSRNGLYTNEEALRVAFEVIIDKGLIGGFIAACRGRVLDTSLKTRLMQLRSSAGQWR